MVVSGGRRTVVDEVACACYWQFSSKIRLCGEPVLHMAGEFLEVVETFGEYRDDQVEIDVEVAVHEHVPEAGDTSEAVPEALRQQVRLHEAAAGGAVAVRIKSECGADVPAMSRAFWAQS